MIAMILPRTLLLLALSASSLAWGDSLESPERIARLGYVEGQVLFRAAQEEATSTLPDRPLVPGDRVVTEAGGRAELALGTATVRLDESTELSIATLDAKTVRVELDQGTVSVHLRELYDDETFAVATPNTTLTLREPGEFRISVPSDGTTDLTVRSGAADGVTAGGPVRAAAGQRVRFEGRQALASLVPPRSTDAFDEWVLDREVQLGEQAPSTDQIATGDEYRELDQYGEWYNEPSYGRVWMPSYAYGGYDPFGYGYWQSYGMGHTWVNSMPWGYYTSHSGRWVYINHLDRWTWVPGRHFHRTERVAVDPTPNRRPHIIDRSDSGKQNGGTPTVIPRRIEPNGVPAWRDVATVKPSRQESPAPRVNREQPAPAQTASPPRSAPSTMQPSRPAETRRAAPSSPPPSTNREVGKIQPP